MLVRASPGALQHGASAPARRVGTISTLREFKRLANGMVHAIFRQNLPQGGSGHGNPHLFFWETFPCLTRF